MNILVSHESPLCLLDESRNYNDICYALVHLFEKYPAYYAHFRSSVLMNREVLLDNSIFELGKAFESTKFVDWIHKLEPSYYIVPDALEQSAETIESYMNFTETYSNLPGLKIGVAQGKTYSEITECYKFMSDCADYIAISFDYSYYQATGRGNTNLERMMTGRQRLIASMIDDGIWRWDKPVHLLGCSLPQEFRYYVNNNIYNIRSLDTSNPVMAGIKKMRYAGDLGMTSKPRGLLAEHLDVELDTDQLNLVKYNLNSFKKIIGR